MLIMDTEISNLEAGYDFKIRLVFSDARYATKLDNNYIWVIFL
jgi:hypothetical protein